MPSFYGTDESEELVGTIFHDDIFGAGGDDTLWGLGSDDALDGGSGDDVLYGGDGNDWLNGGPNNYGDFLIGGLGDDIYVVGDGTNVIEYPGEGYDRIDLWANYFVLADSVDVEKILVHDTGYFEFNQVFGNSAANVIVADVSSVSFHGGGGDDTLYGGDDMDALYGDAGNDVLWSGASYDQLRGGPGDDSYIVPVPDDLIEELAGEGVDTVFTDASYTLLDNVENLFLYTDGVGAAGGANGTGNALDNRIVGNALANILVGLDGDDTLEGGAGNDELSGVYGQDTLQGLAGNDTFNWTSTDGRDTFSGGADFDTVNLTGSAVADVADANWNGSVITGLLNNALLNIEAINLDLGAGGTGGDWLRYNTTSGIAVNLELGTATGFASIAGVENLIGGTGNDDLAGDAGANKINGNAGDDFIYGAGGNDNLIGGLGQDTFVYTAGSGADTINDFDAWDVGGQDFINVQALGIDAGNFASRVTIIDAGADTVVRIDSDVFITLKNVSGDGDNVITVADFILA